MRRALISSLILTCAFINAADAKTYTIKPGAGADASAQAAFAAAKSGDEIAFDEGAFALTRPLALTGDDVKVRGKGPVKTTLSFSGLQGEADSLRVSGNHVEIRDLTIADSKGAAVVASGANILIQGLSARGALGPGIMVLNAQGAIVRNNNASGAMAGFAVQNSSRIELFGNEAASNGAGVVIVNRPGEGVAGSGVRVFRNKITGNAGQGVGVDIIAVPDVLVMENQIGEHGTANILVRAFDGDVADPNFNPLPRNITITRNTFGRAGFAPAHDWAPAVSNGAVFGDVVWDGARSYVSGGVPRTAPVLFAIEGNGGVGAAPRFLSLGLEVAGAPASEAQPSAAWPPIARFAPPAPVKLD
jgi:parallel beta-helix repeat protein